MQIARPRAIAGPFMPASMTPAVAGRTMPAALEPSRVVALRRLGEDDKLAEKLRSAARCWVEEHYDAHKNTARLVEGFEKAMQQQPRKDSESSDHGLRG